MTTDELRVRLAERLPKRFVLKKRGLYWRPDAKGYTGNASEAWLLTEEEADKYVYPHDIPTTKHEAPLPDLRSLVRQAEQSLSEEHGKRYASSLGGVVFKHYILPRPEQDCDQPEEFYAAEIFRLVTAPDEDRARALLEVLG